MAAVVDDGDGMMKRLGDVVRKVEGWVKEMEEIKRMMDCEWMNQDQC